MAKVCRPIVEYKEIIKSTNITLDDYKPPKIAIKRFIRLFKDVDDTRLPGMIDYPLYEILLIAFLSVLGNASTWTDMECFGKNYQKWLKKFLTLENGIPSHDTFRRVFALIDPKQLEYATVRFLAENMNAIKKSLAIKSTGLKQICIDGKEARGSGRKYDTQEKIRNLQTLHVYDASHGICLFSDIIDEKTNEIPAAQAILKTLQLKDTVVTFDALHTQKDTIALIVAGGGDYVGALKGNQSTLENYAKESFSDEIKKNIIENKTDFYETIEKSHNQIEKRRFYMLKVKQTSKSMLEWQKLKNVVCYEKHMSNIVTGKETLETRYYMMSLKDIELAADAIRGHWSVENQLHWHLDYSFGEDDDTTMDKNAFANLSIINKMVLSLCKLVQPLEKGASIRIIRKSFGWGFEKSLAAMLNAFDENSLIQALENANNKKK